jgi:hypothetical protein
VLSHTPVARFGEVAEFHKTFVKTQGMINGERAMEREGSTTMSKETSVGYIGSPVRPPSERRLHAPAPRPTPPKMAPAGPVQLPEVEAGRHAAQEAEREGLEELLLLSSPHGGRVVNPHEIVVPAHHAMASHPQVDSPSVRFLETERIRPSPRPSAGGGGAVATPPRQPPVAEGSPRRKSSTATVTRLAKPPPVEIEPVPEDQEEYYSSSSGEEGEIGQPRKEEAEDAGQAEAVTESEAAALDGFVSGFMEGIRQVMEDTIRSVDENARKREAEEDEEQEQGENDFGHSRAITTSNEDEDDEVTTEVLVPPRSPTPDRDRDEEEPPLPEQVASGLAEFGVLGSTGSSGRAGQQGRPIVEAEQWVSRLLRCSSKESAVRAPELVLGPCLVSARRDAPFLSWQPASEGAEGSVAYTDFLELEYPEFAFVTEVKVAFAQPSKSALVRVLSRDLEGRWWPLWWGDSAQFEKAERPKGAKRGRYVAPPVRLAPYPTRHLRLEFDVELGEVAVYGVHVIGFRRAPVLDQGWVSEAKAILPGTSKLAFKKDKALAAALASGASGSGEALVAAQIANRALAALPGPLWAKTAAACHPANGLLEALTYEFAFDARVFATELSLVLLEPASGHLVDVAVQNGKTGTYSKVWAAGGGLEVDELRLQDGRVGYDHRPFLALSSFATKKVRVTFAGLPASSLVIVAARLGGLAEMQHPQVVRMWPSAVLGVSRESPGRPSDVCLRDLSLAATAVKDDPGSWCPGFKGDPAHRVEDVLEVGLSVPVRVTKIRVFESWSGGSIVRISAMDSLTLRYDPVWERPAPGRERDGWEPGSDYDELGAFSPPLSHVAVGKRYAAIRLEMCPSMVNQDGPIQISGISVTGYAPL